MECEIDIRQYVVKSTAIEPNMYNRISCVFTHVREYEVVRIFGESIKWIL